jgi:hypothetical protein
VKAKDKQFAQDWEEAIKDGTEGLEDIALEGQKQQ